LLLMRSSQCGAHTVTRLSVQDWTSVLGRLQMKKPKKRIGGFKETRHCTSSNVLRCDYGDEGTHRNNMVIV